MTYPITEKTGQPRTLVPQMTVFTVEVFDTFTAATVGFHAITATSIEEIAELATELMIAMGHGRNTALDWRRIAEHPYSPAVPDTSVLRMVDKG